MIGVSVIYYSLLSFLYLSRDVTTYCCSVHVGKYLLRNYLFFSIRIGSSVLFMDKVSSESSSAKPDSNITNINDFPPVIKEFFWNVSINIENKANGQQHVGFVQHRSLMHTKQLQTSRNFGKTNIKACSMNGKNLKQSTNDTTPPKINTVFSRDREKC